MENIQLIQTYSLEQFKMYMTKFSKTSKDDRKIVANLYFELEFSDKTECILDWLNDDKNL